MLQVSGSCAHIWDPNSVYIETKPIHWRRGLKSNPEYAYDAYSGFDFNPLRICTGLLLMYLQLILNPYANEWV